MAASKGSAAEPRNIPDGPVAIPWGNVLNPKYDWDKKEVLEVIYWLRQAVALLCGLLWGLLGVTGFIGNVSFILICLLVAWVYYAKIISVDQDEMGQWDLASEGFMAGYGFFLVCWISVYSLTLKAQ